MTVIIDYGDEKRELLENVSHIKTNKNEVLIFFDSGQARAIQKRDFIELEVQE